ncbi:MAG: hypothetical protein EOP04_25260, partial [Proteobacteria bacterium]
MILLGPLGFGGELTQYLESQPHDSLSVKGLFESDYFQDAYAIREDASFALQIWFAAFYRKNSAASGEALVLVGENKFKIEKHTHTYQMPPYLTAHRSDVEKEIAWLLEDPARVEYATDLVTTAISGKESDGNYRFKALDLFRT